jgi:hypothetical protein
MIGMTPYPPTLRLEIEEMICRRLFRLDGNWHGLANGPGKPRERRLDRWTAAHHVTTNGVRA